MNPLMLLQTDLKNIVKDGKIADKDNLLSDDIESDFKDFLSKLLLEVEKDGKNSILKIPKPDSDVDKTDLLIKEASKELKIDTKGGLSKKDDSFSLDELLQLVISLKTNGLKGSFPKDTKKIDNILNDKKIVQDFKSIKNFKDLLKVAKKYDIKIEKFEFSIDNEKKVEIKIDKVLKKVDNEVKTSLKQYKISSEKVLSNIKTKHTKTKNTKATDTSEKEKSMLSSILKNDTKTKEISKDIKVKDDTQEQKIAKVENDNQKKEISNTNNIKIESHIKKPNITKSNKQYIKNDITQKPKTLKEVTITQEEINIEKKDKKPKHTIQTQIKEATSFQKSKTFNKIVDNVKKDRVELTTKKHTKLSKELEIAQSDKDTKHLNEVKENLSHQKNEPHFQHSSETIAKPSSPIHIKHTQARQTLNSFVNDLKEQIENYKPPIMRVKMALNPKDLGEVNVSLVNRGNNLQITINSNTNTMAIFTQNQAEFKSALVNMGFTNLNMNFSSNSNSQNNQQNRHRNNKENDIESIENIDNELEDTQTLTLTMPRYI